MAESQTVDNQALEDQLTCAICLDAFKDPKLLQCFHVYCKDCLQQLVVQDRQGQLSLRCPTCQQSTLLPPATNVSGLQPAFHIHRRFEIQKALKKMKESQKVQCEKCTKTSRTATSFCRDCGEFICERCSETHTEWKELSKHEVVSIEQIQSNVDQLVPPKKVSLYCSQHQGKELDLYCETCGELICLHCTVKKHKDHQYDLVGDIFERHKAEITASLEPVENQLTVVTDALEKLNVLSQELNDQRAAVETNIQQQIQQLHESLEVRKAELISQLDRQIQMKMKMVQTQLVSCLSFVRESLRMGSLGEVMKMKNAIVKQIKDMTDNFKLDTLPPLEPSNVKFTASSQLLPACQQFGEVYLQQVSPEKCYATGKGLEVAELDEKATAVLHVVDHKGKACTTPVETLTCELVSASTHMKTKCSVKKTEASQYEISYQPTSRGRHQLYIKVEGKHIKGSPFTVTVKLPVQKLGTPSKIISGANKPWGVAVNQRGDIIVAESSGHCVSIFSPAGEKIQSFGSQGLSHGQFSSPEGVAVDDEDNILVVDYGNHRIQKVTSTGQFITTVGKRGDKDLEFRSPIGIGIHPHTGMVYVADTNNDRVQILNFDLTFYSSFGSHGGDNGQFNQPYDVAFDSIGNVYVADYANHRIQVFTAAGQFVRKFGSYGKGDGELHYPVSIGIDSDIMVYVAELNNCVSVFTCEGKFLSSFGSKGSGPGQLSSPRGVAVDMNGVVYVSDSGSSHVKLFC